MNRKCSWGTNMTQDIVNAVKEAKEQSKPRNFTESVDIIINIRDLDVKKPENRFNEEVTLPKGRGKDVKIGVIADGELIVQAKDAGLDVVINKVDLEEFGKDRKSVHLRNTYNMEEELMEVLDQYQADFDKMAEEVAESFEYKTEDAEILVIAHGIVARSAMTAIDELRAKGIKAGLFRPITIRPLDVKAMRSAVSKVKQVLFTESANGQLAQMCLEKLYGLTTPYSTLFKMGVGVTGDDIVNKVMEMSKQPATV